MEFFDRAFVGILVGFTLKAVFDLLTTRQQDRREDRLRFVDRRLQAYADFVTAMQDAVHLRTSAQQAHAQRNVLAAEAKEMLQRLDELDASEEARVQREEMWTRVRNQQQMVADLSSKGALITADVMENRRNLSGAAALIGLLSTRGVTRTANRLVDLLDSESESASSAQSDALVRDFMSAARRELGTRAPHRLLRGSE